MNAPVRRCEKLVVIGVRKCRNKVKKNYGKMIRQDMIQFYFIEDITLDRKMWKVEK